MPQLVRVTDKIPVNLSHIETFEQWVREQATALIEASWRGGCDRKDVEAALDEANNWHPPYRCTICAHYYDECDCAKTGRR